MAISVANLLEIQPNSAALFYRKLREVIALHLDEDAYEIFEGQSSWMRAILVAPVRKTWSWCCWQSCSLWHIKTWWQGIHQGS